MRLDKLLAHSGFGTRKEVKKLLKTKFVEVDGEVITSPKTHVDPEKQSILVGGQPLNYQEYVYFMLHKPGGVITATEDEMHMTVLDLLEPNDLVQEPHPVGRLDIDTEGLLILTNDGKLTHQLISPNRHVDKVYYAEIEGIMTEQDQQVFREGIILDDDLETLPAQLEILSVDEEIQTSKVKITVQEGKFHQVKRMVHACGKEVEYLKRLSMGKLSLDESLPVGEYRECTKEEIQLLKDS